MKKLRKNGTAGFTLVELMVATALFVVVMSISTEIFIRTADSQARSVSAKSVQESAAFALAAMVSEMKGARPIGDTCVAACETPLPFFCTAGADLVFKNEHDLCVTYSIENDVDDIPRLKVVRGYSTGDKVDYLTPPSVRVSDLHFSTEGLDDANFPLAKATIFLKLETLTDAAVPASAAVQTTVVGPSDIYMH